MQKPQPQQPLVAARGMSASENDDRDIVWFAILCRVVVLLCVFFSDVLLANYDSSDRSSGTFAKFDIVHFEFIARAGYRIEQHFAFNPLLPILVLRPLLALQTTFASWFPALSGVILQDSLRLAVAAAICNALFIVSVYFFCKVARQVLPDGTSARTAACCYVVNPAGVFLAAPYSEAPYLAALLGYLYLRGAKRTDPPALLMLSVCYFAAIGVRSNGILISGFAVVDIVRLAVESVGCEYPANRGAVQAAAFDTSAPSQATASQENHRKRVACSASRRTSIGRAAALLFQLLLLGGGLAVRVGMTLLAKSSFCCASAMDTLRAAGVEPAERPWCADGAFGCGAFCFVQSEYWGVGLLRYWRPFFPQLARCAHVLPLLGLAALSVGVLSRPAMGSCLTTLRSLREHRCTAKPFLITFLRAVTAIVCCEQAVHAVFLLVALLSNVLVAHVHIATRFIACYPGFYLGLGVLASNSSERVARFVIALYVVLCLVYTVLGVVMWPNYFAWV